MLEVHLLAEPPQIRTIAGDMAKNRLQDHYYPESRFGGFTRIDGTIAFYARVYALASKASTILDVGCGRGAHEDDAVELRRNLRDLRAPGKRVIGIDVDAEAKGNKFIDEFRLMTNATWPLDSASVDLCLADSVLEHVTVPDAFFSEARRVLRVGGVLCIRTTNSWSYVALASRIIPNAAHGKVLQKIQRERQTRDVFPTVYRCNSASNIRRTLARHGFSGIVFGHEAEPSYLHFSRVAYFLGVLHQRMVPSLFAPTLFVFAEVTAT